MKKLVILFVSFIVSINCYAYNGPVITNKYSQANKQKDIFKDCQMMAYYDQVIANHMSNGSYNPTRQENNKLSDRSALFMGMCKKTNGKYPNVSIKIIHLLKKDALYFKKIAEKGSDSSTTQSSNQQENIILGCVKGGSELSGFAHAIKTGQIKDMSVNQKNTLDKSISILKSVCHGANVPNLNSQQFSEFESAIRNIRRIEVAAEN